MFILLDKQSSDSRTECIFWFLWVGVVIIDRVKATHKKSFVTQ